MKKALFLCFILAAFIVLGQNIPQALADKVELKYDDGSEEAYSAPGSEEDLSEIAVRFSIPQPPTFPLVPASLKYVRFFIPLYKSPTSGFFIRVYAADGENGLPGTQLNAEPEGEDEITVRATDADGWIQWNMWKVTNPVVFNDGQDFYVSMCWKKSAGTNAKKKVQFLGCDLGKEVANRSYLKDADTGEWQLMEDRNAMIRVVITDEEVPAVSVTAADPIASGTENTGIFEFTRTGGDLTKALTVRYNLDKESDDAAINGKDFKKLKRKLKIPANESTAQVVVQPSGKVKEGSKTVRLTLGHGIYTLADPLSAEVVIQGEN